jgi:hypothetical protein
VVSGEREGGDKNPVFLAYTARARDEYRSLSPTPDQLANFEAALDHMWGTARALVSYPTSATSQYCRIPWHSTRP